MLSFLLLRCVSAGCCGYYPWLPWWLWCVITLATSSPVTVVTTEEIGAFFPGPAEAWPHAMAAAGAYTEINPALLAQHPLMHPQLIQVGYIR